MHFTVAGRAPQLSPITAGSGNRCAVGVPRYQRGGHARTARRSSAGIAFAFWQIELRYAGTGLGQKTIADIAETTGVPLEAVMARLQAADIAAAPGDKMKAVAAEHDDMAPIDLLKVILDASP